MTKRIRISISVALASMSVIATAAAAVSPVVESATMPVGLLTGALLCVVLTLLVWSDDLDRRAIRRARSRRGA
jgi:hypothetical protein